jgi:alpha-aminoadipic semialdehyde synthase
MDLVLGIRREDKNKWERRVPITPDHVKKLKEKFNIKTVVQSSKIRIYSDQEYEKSGAMVREDISDCPIVFAVKEIPKDFFRPKKTYVFFSHTIKGQKYNMPMLKKMMALGCNLIDYEKISDEYGRRIVFFGRYAGIAGMTDTFWSFGRRMEFQNIYTPLNDIKQTIDYENLSEIKNHFKKIGKKIKNEGFPGKLSPIVVGFAGYGNVSRGAQEMIDLLPVVEIAPNELESLFNRSSKYCIYKIIFKEKDMVRNLSSEYNFDLQDYYDYPEKYESVFEKFVPYLTILMNCIFWNPKYPRLITKKYLKKSFNENFKLNVVGDISIDINGAIEFTEKITNPGNPCFVYNPFKDTVVDGIKGIGIVVMGVDNLPCELPRESSQSFSDSLIDLIPKIVSADFTRNFEDFDIDPIIKKAVILYNGKLTPGFKYIDKYL